MKESISESQYGLQSDSTCKFMSHGNFLVMGLDYAFLLEYSSCSNFGQQYVDWNAANWNSIWDLTISFGGTRSCYL